MSGISTHVLDLAQGKPASNVPVTLQRCDAGVWVELAARQTDADGRSNEMLPPGEVSPGEYRLTFNIAAYQNAPLYPEIVIRFSVAPGAVHYHLPLLLSPHGYTTYRGS